MMSCATRPLPLVDTPVVAAEVGCGSTTLTARSEGRMPSLPSSDGPTLPRRVGRFHQSAEKTAVEPHENRPIADGRFLVDTVM
jgi:hypothetical protein